MITTSSSITFLASRSVTVVSIMNLLVKFLNLGCQGLEIIQMLVIEGSELTASAQLTRDSEHVMGMRNTIFNFHCSHT